MKIVVKRKRQYCEMKKKNPFVDTLLLNKGNLFANRLHFIQRIKNVYIPIKVHPY